MILSQRSHTIQPQPMFRIMEQAQELERQGRKIIHLEIGDTTGFVNERLRELVCEEAAKSRFGYSPSAGEMELREAVAEMYSKAKGVTFTHENVAIGPANALITQVLAAVTEPGDSIRIPVPGFPTYQLAANFLGLKTNDGNPKAIIVNSESNPMGKYISPAMLEIMPESRRIPVIFDEAYRLFCYTESSPVEHRDNYVYLWTLSKEAAAPGLRIGAVIGPQQLVAKVADFTSMFNSCSQGFIQLAAARYLREGARFAAGLGDIMQMAARTALGILAGAPTLNVNVPQSGMYLWVRSSRAAPAATLLNEFGVAVSPGWAFAPNDYYNFRITLAVPVVDLVEGCQRIVEFANGLERRAA